MALCEPAVALIELAWVYGDYRGDGTKLRVRRRSARAERENCEKPRKGSMENRCLCSHDNGWVRCGLFFWQPWDLGV
jgi:hypothetical protein